MSTFRLITLLVLLAIGGCQKADPMKGFMHMYRQTYAIGPQELKNLQFFISREVLVQYEDAAATKTLILPRATPGIVTDVGDTWLKVSFREGGVDVPFVTDTGLKYDLYWLAINEPSGSAYEKLKDSDRTIFHEGIAYKVLYGNDAHLLVERKAFEKLIDKRIATEGRELGK